jgi:hypothetical protein
MEQVVVAKDGTTVAEAILDQLATLNATMAKISATLELLTNIIGNR